MGSARRSCPAPVSATRTATFASTASEAQKRHRRLLLDRREPRKSAVDKQQSRFDHQRTGDRGALALSLGELLGLGLRALLGLAGEQAPLSLSPRGAVLATVDQQREFYMLQHTESGCPRLVAPHAANLATSVASPLCVRHPAHGFALVCDRAAIRSLQSRGNPQQRCLARSAGPEDPAIWRAKQLQADTVER